MEEQNANNSLARIISKVEPLFNSAPEDKKTDFAQGEPRKVDLAMITKMFKEFVVTASPEEIEKFAKAVLEPSSQTLTK